MLLIVWTSQTQSPLMVHGSLSALIYMLCSYNKLQPPADNILSIITGQKKKKKKKETTKQKHFSQFIIIKFNFLCVTAEA